MHDEIPPYDREGLIRTAATLRRLAADLIEIAEGRAPRAEDLVHAPIIDRYVLAEKRTPCLVGVQTGHPVLTGPLIETSEAYVMSEAKGWARILSRYYRLGQPLAKPFDA